jgi:hypothetical protein
MEGNATTTAFTSSTLTNCAAHNNANTAPRRHPIAAPTPIGLLKRFSLIVSVV